MVKKDKYSVVSLFSGCGGLDRGFEGGFNYLGNKHEELPFKIVFANDIMPQACETLRLNFNTPLVLCEDIKEVLDKKSNTIPSADVVTGGFPCQDFSTAGKRRGFNSERGKLYQQMKKVVELVKPKIFVAENVKGLTNLGSALSRITTDFANSKPRYEVDYQILMAANYGVPQSRERVIIIGVREDIAAKMKVKDKKFKFPFPEHTHSAINGALPAWVTAKQAIGDLEGSDTDRQDEISRAKNYGEHLQGNKKIEANKIAPTIRAEHHGNIEFHYNGRRRLSVRECARIQSFPDNFKFFGSASKAYVQIGNAVPPLLGWHVAKAVQKVLDNYG